eukprot:3223386-Pleurochrysis_carterae.AAC.2
MRKLFVVPHDRHPSRRLLSMSRTILLDDLQLFFVLTINNALCGHVYAMGYVCAMPDPQRSRHKVGAVGKLRGSRGVANLSPAALLALKHRLSPRLWSCKRSWAAISQGNCIKPCRFVRGRNPQLCGCMEINKRKRMDADHERPGCGSERTHV